MVVQKSEILQEVRVAYSKNKSKFYSRAKLNLDGTDIYIESEFFDTIDEAVSSIKERIIEAIKKFKPNSND